MAAALPLRRVAIIADCDTEVGAAAASRLVEAGHQLVFCSLDDTSIAEPALKVANAQAQALSLKCDLSSRTSAAAALDVIEREFGRLDVLVIGPAASDTNDRRSD